MTTRTEVDRTRSERVAFRAELADFGDFYERTYPGAYRTALGIVREAALAADVTQDAYVAAYRQRGRFRGDAPAGAWLHRIVVNESLAALRRRHPVHWMANLMPPAEADHPTDTAARLSVLAALEALPHRHRAAVILRYYHDYDYATIAQIMATTPTNVGAMLSRALDRLRVAMEPDSGATTERGADR